MNLTRRDQPDREQVKNSFERLSVALAFSGNAPRKRAVHDTRPR